MKAVIWKTLVDGISIKEIAEEYEVTADHLYKIRRKFMVEAMDEKNIRSYYLVQESIRIEKRIVRSSVCKIAYSILCGMHKNGASLML